MSKKTDLMHIHIENDVQELYKKLCNDITNETEGKSIYFIMDTLDAANVLNIKVKLIYDIIESQKFDIIVGASGEFQVYNTGYYDVISSKKYDLENEDRKLAGSIHDGEKAFYEICSILKK